MRETASGTSSQVLEFGRRLELFKMKNMKISIHFSIERESKRERERGNVRGEIASLNSHSSLAERFEGNL